MIARAIRVTAVVVILAFEAVTMWRSVLDPAGKKRVGALLKFAFALALYGAAGLYDIFIRTVTD